MIAKYKGEYYNYTNYPKYKHCIWRYNPVDGFTKHEFKNDSIVYMKEVTLLDLEELFLEVFSVCWHGENFVAAILDDGQLFILSDELSDDFVSKHPLNYNNALQFWSNTIDIDECSEFYCKKMMDYPDCRDEVITLSKEEWLKEYNKISALRKEKQ